MISISVLGPVELQRDGVAVPVGPGKTTLDAADDLMPPARHLLGSADRLDADHGGALIAAGSTG